MSWCLLAIAAIIILPNQRGRRTLYMLIMAALTFAFFGAVVMWL